MSTYLDIASGKWFDTRQEMLAYQRGEGQPSPRSVSKEQVKPDSTEPKTENRETAEPIDAQVEDAETTDRSEKEQSELDFYIAKGLTKGAKELRKELKDNYGFDGRTMRHLDDDEIREMFIKLVRKRWPNVEPIEE